MIFSGFYGHGRKHWRNTKQIAVPILGIDVKFNIAEESIVVPMKRKLHVQICTK
jgi:hypothetical protein